MMTNPAASVTQYTAEEIISRMSWVGIVIAILGFLIFIYANDLSRIALAGRKETDGN